MGRAARRIAGFTSVLALSLVGVVPAPPSYAVPTAPSRSRPAAGSGLTVTVTKVGNGTVVGIGTIRPDRPVVVHGTVGNPSPTDWRNIRIYLQITRAPATDLSALRAFAAVPDNPATGSPSLDDEAIANTVFDAGRFVLLDELAPGQHHRFRLDVPYDLLQISGEPGVYRVGVLVLASSGAARPPVRTSTLMPLLPTDPAPTPAQTLTLLPLSAPIKTLGDGIFADDSLHTLISPTGRLTNVLGWLGLAAPGTVQVVVDPALVTAVEDMADGYRVRSIEPGATTMPGDGRADAQAWLAEFDRTTAAQRVMYLPWGGPAANALLDQGLPGPIIAAVEASRTYQRTHLRGSAVAGWLNAGSSGIRAVTKLRHIGIDLQIVAQESLPGLAATEQAGRPVPSQVTITGGDRHIPVLVTSTHLTGLTTTPMTSALQFRQRLIADATVRSLNGLTDTITVTALPFTWNPGRPRASASLARAFELPVVVAQSVIGALDRTGVSYTGPVRPTSLAFHALSTPVVQAIHDLRLSGGNLAAILSPAVVAERDFQRVFAMSGSAQWRVFPLIAIRLISERASADRAALQKVSVTGPPFVAMSSGDGRFPLTVTNGLGRPITVTIAVSPQDPALKIAPIQPISLTPGQRRDVQVVTTVSGSGVTSVRARLATADGSRRFGKPWRFDVRATQIGLVIWIVMAVGGVILFGTAGIRIVRRLRRRDGPRRPAPA